MEETWDVCNPTRSESCWATYPTEQRLEEHFQNHMLNLIAQSHGFTTALDWSFGPLLMRRKFAQLWIEFDGGAYDAQWGPMVRAFQENKALTIGTPLVDYKHTTIMRDQEEGDIDFAFKRLAQLQSVVETFKRLWPENMQVGSKRRKC